MSPFSTTAPLLAAYGLTYSWTEVAGARTLDEITFEVARGEIIALMGPNGCGKSTLLKLLAGIIPANAPLGSGAIRIQAEELRTFSAAARARMIAYVGAELRTEFPLTAYDVVALGRTCHGSDRRPDLIQAAMERTSCWSLRGRDVRTLSGGERQLVLLARALAQRSRVLLLDEALSRMDLHHQAMSGALLRSLAEEGYAIILVAHDLNLAAEWASRCILLKEGKLLAQGPIESTLTDLNLSKLYPHARLSVAPSPASGAPKVFFGKNA